MSSIDRELTRALTGNFTLTLPLELNTPHKYIIFSDQHKGAGDKADEFRKCRNTYVAALQHYLGANFTFILLGDAEELWEQGFKEVEREYSSVLSLEGSFPPGRYYRIWGNHDDEWMSERSVNNKLAKYMPTAVIFEAIRFELVKDSDFVGRVFLVHGHQGTFDSDKLRWLGRIVLPIYRQIQRWTGIGKQTPAQDACLRGAHDTNMYEWAEKQDKLILIAGHTHRPVWSSRTHLQKLEAELAEIKKEPESPEREERIREKEQEVQERAEKYTPCEDTIKTVPCYFNTGCCKFDDGDITGIEIEDGEIRLIKWSNETKQRVKLEAEPLLTIMEGLRR